MFRSRAHRKLIAWFAMLAIGLLSAAPTVSRVVAAAAAQARIGCVEHAGAGHDGDRGGQPADGLDACGYCTLASHGTVLTGAIAHVVPAVPAAPFAVADHRPDVVVVAAHCPPVRGPPTSHAALA